VHLDRVRQLAEGSGQRIVESLDEGRAQWALLRPQRLAGGADAGRPPNDDEGCEDEDERSPPW